MGGGWRRHHILKEGGMTGAAWQEVGPVIRPGFADTGAQKPSVPFPQRFHVYEHVAVRVGGCSELFPREDTAR